MIPNFTADAALLPSHNTYRVAAGNGYGRLVAVPQQSNLSRQTLNDGSADDGADLADCGTITCPGCQNCHDTLRCC
jgi:hypothetical protein